MRTNHSVRRPGGFTLVEMIITISVIALLTTVAMPGLIQLFRSGADAGAYNLMYSELVNARGRAIQNGTYAGVHFQPCDIDRDTKVKITEPSQFKGFYCGVVEIPQANMKTPANRKFELAGGFTVQDMPGDMAFGAVDGTSYSGTAYTDPGDIAAFTTFTVAFSPSGGIVKTVPGAAANGNLLFNSTADLFTFKPVWSDTLANAGGAGKPGVSTITMFEYKAMSGSGNRAAYLNKYAQALPINLYTGQLYDRK